MNINEYKNPLTNQYVAPYGYHFEMDGKAIGRIIWTNNIDSIIVKEDD